MIKVTNEVDTYDEPAKATIKVHSHWCRNEMVVIDVGGLSVTVKARELKLAIDNASNTK